MRILKIACLAVLFLCALPVAADERIRSFDSRIQVNTDGTLTVTETLEVRHEGIKIRRGIYRDLPTKDGAAYKALNVRRDGRAEPFFVERVGGFYRINTGNDNFLRHPGTSVFEITYTAKHTGLGRYDGYDEVYWNVTGDKWAFPIDRVTAEVILPDGVFEIQQASYIGARGSREAGYYLGSGRFKGRSLRPGEQFTIALGFTPNVVNIQKAPVADSTKDVIGAGLIFGGVLIYFAVVWFFLGRDPRRRAIVPEFEAPTGLSAAQCCFLKNGFAKAQQVCIAHFIQMASDGFISITEKKRKILWFETTTYEVKPTSRKPQNTEEKRFESEFPNGLVVTGSYDEKLGEYVKEFTKKTRKEMKPYYRTNSAWLAGGYGLLVALSFLFGNIDSAGGSEFLGVVILLFYIPFLSLMFYINILIGLFVIPHMAIFVLNLYSFWQGMAIMGAIVFLFPTFRYLLFQPTEKGARSMEQLKGLEMFLKAVDIKTPGGFKAEDMESLYPYALALGLEKKWEEKFKKMFGAALIAHSAIHSPAFASSFGSSLASSSGSRGGGSGGGGGAGGGGGGGGGGGR